MHVSYWTRFAPPEVIVLDIGQGDAILIRDGPSTLLVDAGIGEATRTALARNHVFGLDGVVVTHWDKDHWGGLPDVLESVRVDRLYVADGAADHIPAELSDGPAVSELREGDAVRSAPSSVSLFGRMPGFVATRTRTRRCWMFPMRGHAGAFAFC
ncbi:MAG: MBL fold metallo-hydrolase [Collinsella intestinalis]